MENSKGDL